MPEGFYKQIISQLKKAGFQRAKGGKGSHEKWIAPDGSRVLVPQSSKSRHTANSIMKDAGIDHKF
ncbi:MAG: addiction module toxin, HicA family protein [Hyphobacterium sp.]|nr:MAG: addiction module toxin, HicA family protein [Hyphobacterium sp.]